MAYANFHFENEKMAAIFFNLKIKCMRFDLNQLKKFGNLIGISDFELKYSLNHQVGFKSLNDDIVSHKEL